MIPRYAPQDFLDLWSARTRFEVWLDVELAACRAMERAGTVPTGTSEAILPVRSRIIPERIDEIERTTRHDVIAFLTHVEELAGPPARYLHRGMTSSDVLDTALAILMKRSAEKLLEQTDSLLAALQSRIEEHRHTPMIGRSHGIHAEPVTFGLVLAGHYAEIKRNKKRLEQARDEISVGKIAGAVGTYAHLTPQIEDEALSELGLRPETVATQIVARDRHAYFHNALALMAAAIERFATNVRHWQRTEVGEAEEHFKSGQKGSSAMPHKRNPVLTENLCGLARVVRATAAPALENVVLWHERDISHSSVERMLVPDATATLAFMLDRTATVARELVVNVERQEQNLNSCRGLWASEAVLLQLVDTGVARQEAYVWVQRNAMRTFHGEGSFLEFLAVDEDIAPRMSRADLEQCFNLEHVLTHVNYAIDRALRES